MNPRQPIRDRITRLHIDASTRIGNRINGRVGNRASMKVERVMYGNVFWRCENLNACLHHHLEQ